MDPLSALSLAGNVVQFVEFAAKLFKRTCEIHSSSTESSKGDGNLDHICQRLLAFSSYMKHMPSKTISEEFHTCGLSAYSQDLQQLLTKCSEDCQSLLQITQKLRASNSSESRKWKSFKKATHEVWHDEDIENLQDRINNNRQDMVIILCAISA